MKMHQVAASVLCMALLLALCLSVACSEEIMPFAESGNSVRAVLSFSGGKVIGESRVKKLEVGMCREYNCLCAGQERERMDDQGFGKRWPGSKRFLHSAKGYGIPHLCRCNDL
ncbi:MAG: hypothetical protein ACLVB5_13915 [Christensenellales bacterium]